MFLGRQCEDPGEDQHDRRPNGGGEVGIDILNTDLRKDRGRSCKRRGQQRPEYPVLPRE